MLRKSVALTALVMTLGLSSIAQAETPLLAALREDVQSLDVRAKALRTLAERASPEVRRESERIVTVVDAQRRFLATRIDLLQLLGLADGADDETLLEIRTKCDAAKRLLSIVEGWFRSR